MTEGDWLAVVTITILSVYEVGLRIAQRVRPSALARAAHGTIRAQWVQEMARHPGSEILAVQTLRNAVMSSTMIASTAAIGLIGAANLAAPSLQSSFGGTGVAPITSRLVLELFVLALLFASLVCTAMAVRYYNHVGFIVSMPVGSPARERWSSTSVLYLRRAGFLYGWGLHHLLLVAPVLGAIVSPWAGPPAAIVLVVVLAGFDRFASTTDA